MFYLVIKLTKPLTLLKAQVVRDEKLRDVSVSSFSVRMILDCFIPNLKLKYKEAENIKTVLVSNVVFNLHQIKETEDTR